jgi:hypothetical protein
MHCVQGLGYTSNYRNLPKYFSFLHSHTFHIWKCTLDPETGHPTCVINHPLFFAFFFFFGTATPFIYGNAPWTLQHHPQHCHQPAPILFLIFPLFYCHFSLLHNHNSHIWKFITQCHHHSSPIFPLFYCYFSVESAPISIFGSALLDPENKKNPKFVLKLGPLTPLQTRKIYPDPKYILRPGQYKNIFLRCDSDISGSTHQKYILTPFLLQNIFCRCDTDIIIFV